MNLIVDLVFVVFLAVITWKIKKLDEKTALIRNDLDITMKNPQAAKRLLKKRE